MPWKSWIYEFARGGGDKHGFTLIELSVVLVIIGLIVGGILVGQDLIKSAEERAQISQITKYNQAVNTFRDKYGGLPGDLPAAYAGKFGGLFVLRGSNPGQGDGNGIIQGTQAGGQNPNGTLEDNGETVMFWADLSAAGLIDGSFPTVRYINNNRYLLHFIYLS